MQICPHCGSPNTVKNGVSCNNGTPKRKCKDCGRQWTESDLSRKSADQIFEPCPKCGGNAVKNGVDNGRQRYKCKGCSYIWKVERAIAPQFVYEACPKCGGRSVKNGKYKGRQNYKCKDCKTSWSESH